MGQGMKIASSVSYTKELIVYFLKFDLAWSYYVYLVLLPISDKRIVYVLKTKLGYFSKL